MFFGFIVVNDRFRGGVLRRVLWLRLDGIERKMIPVVEVPEEEMRELG
ncbi:MAG: hypothetical protein NTV61_06480 [Candidatus Bathyarchaeota archaeon]|nr:hypothetical protein [Candidatus Bathyarchaeota archaeon]